MPFHVTVLRSGSKGNATLVESDKTRLLIDCGGIAAQDIYAGRLRVKPASIDAIVITHAHGDHINEETVALAYVYEIPIYLHRSVVRSSARIAWPLRSLPTGLKRYYGDSIFRVGDIRIRVIEVGHARAKRIGRCHAFRLSWTGRRAYYLGYATDLGVVPAALERAFSACDCLVLEANHDVGMQWGSDRPYFLKRWILGDDGHLSNEQSGVAVRRISDRHPRTRPRQLVLAHLSDDCNTPRRALAGIRAARYFSTGKGPDVVCASQRCRTKRIRIDGRA